MKHAAARAPMVSIALGGCAAFVGALAVVGCAGLIGANFDRPAAPDAAASDEAGVEGGPSPFTLVSAVPQGETFFAVWAADANNVFVVGSNGVHDDYWGGAWHREQDVTGREYVGLFGTSVSDVYAVGTQQADGRGVIQHFDGQAWRDEYLAPTGLNGIWGAGGLIYAVGPGGNVYGKQQGTTAWAMRLSQGLPANPKVPVTASSPILWGISGNNKDNFALAAGQDRVFHYEGNGNFVNLDPAVDRTVDFRAVWGPPSSQTNIFFGTNYLGINWLSAPRAAPGLDATLVDDQMVRIHEELGASDAKDLFVNAIWGTNAKVLFVGDTGKIFSFDLATNDFGVLASPTTQALQGVSGTSLSDVWIVGANELILHGSVAN